MMRFALSHVSLDRLIYTSAHILTVMIAAYDRDACLPLSRTIGQSVYFALEGMHAESLLHHG